MIKKQCFLNDIFQPKTALKEQQNSRQNNITKFIQCFNNSTGKRSRQIRILQIGNSCNTKLNIKPFSKSQSIKQNPQSALLNNQILFKSHLNNNKQKFFFVQGVRKKSDKCQVQMIKSINGKRQKNSGCFMHRQTLSCQKNQNRGKSWAIRNKNLEQLPSSFYIKNNNYRDTNSPSPQSRREKLSSEIQNLKNSQPNSPTNIKTKTSKSVNLLNKIKAIQQYSTGQTATIKFPQKYNTFQNKKNTQELIQQQRKAKLQIKKQISLDYAKPFNPPTNISAYSYAVYEPMFSAKKNRKKIIINDGIQDHVKVQSQKKFPHSHKIIISQNSRTQVEVASLTKIMTCILAINISNQYCINPKNQFIQIGKFQSQIGGTTANISVGEIYTLQNLFYGLMLPSGNDASVAIAVWGGRVLLNNESTGPNINYKKKQCYDRFIREMNKLSNKIGMQKTNYANSHGLMNCDNKSCAYDLCILCQYAMNCDKFKQIVSTQIYTCTIRYTIDNKVLSPGRKSIKNINKLIQTSKIKPEDDDEVDDGEDVDLNLNEEQVQNQNIDGNKEYGYKEVNWENTHKLLQQKPKQYIGIKTGITTAAGPCLASCVKNDFGRFFIIIVLNCEKMSMRFKDTQNLKRWALQREGLSSPKKKSKQINNSIKFGDPLQEQVI